MTVAGFLERLPQLLDELRQLGFSVGVEQHVAVYELLIGLAARKAFPLENQKAFSRLLSPLIAKSPLQQEIFATFFDNWLKGLPTSEKDTGDAFSRSFAVFCG